MHEPTNGGGALVAGGIAALLASTCCLGPLALVALEFSGGMDRQPDGTRAVSSPVHWHGTICAVLRRASNFPHPPKSASRVMYAPCHA